MKDVFNNTIGPQLRTKKRQRKPLIPAIAAASIFAGLQAATQYFAYEFGYQPGLGFNVNHIYPFWKIIPWAFDYQSIYLLEVQKAMSIGTLVGTSGLIAAAVGRMIQANSGKANEYLHGSARWANLKDIQDSGLLPHPLSLWERITGKKERQSQGVYVGAYIDKQGRQQYLRHNGPEHVLTYAPTRSGKGVGLVVPTLLSWPHSAVITDLKGELWAMTAGWRKKYAKNKVIRFEPAALNGGAAWNALDEIRLSTDAEVGDVQNLATLIVDPDGKGLESHWQKTSQALLVGVILHALYKAKNGDAEPATLPLVDKMLADPNRDVAELWMEMVTYGHVNGEPHPTVAAAARDMLDRPEEEGGSVLSTAKSYLALYRDPVVARNVSRSEFTIKDLMYHDDPVSLYIVTQPNDKARLRPLVRILMNMIVRLLADKMEFERATAELPAWKKFLNKFGFKNTAHSYVKSKKSYKHRLLGMIDEFPSLGKLEILQESLAFVAGYGIKFYLIYQDLNQLKSRETGYGPDETITSNCHVQNAYPPNRLETAEHLSKLTGLTTILKENITTSGKRASAMLSGVSRTTTEVQRALLTVDEVQRMPGPTKDAEGQIKEAGDMVIYVAGYPAIYGKQPLYFKDEIFTARAAVEEPKESDKIRVFKDHETEEGITI
jgi:type IV secretion system protein VirD4